MGDIVRIFEGAGLHYYNDIVLKTPIGTAALRARKGMTHRKVTKIHQNLLIFYKGDNFNEVGKEFGAVEGIEEVLEGLQDESEDI